MPHTPHVTTLAVPEDLVRRPHARAAATGPNLSAARSHLKPATAAAEADTSRESLTAFSEGLISKDQAVKDLGLRDYTELLPLLGAAGLRLPTLPPEELSNQAALIARIHKQS